MRSQGWGVKNYTILIDVRKLDAINQIHRLKFILIGEKRLLPISLIVALITLLLALSMNMIVEVSLTSRISGQSTDAHWKKVYSKQK